MSRIETARGWGHFAFRDANRFQSLMLCTEAVERVAGLLDFGPFESRFTGRSVTCPTSLT